MKAYRCIYCTLHVNRAHLARCMRCEHCCFNSLPVCLRASHVRSPRNQLNHSAFSLPLKAVFVVGSPRAPHSLSAFVRQGQEAKILTLHFADYFPSSPHNEHQNLRKENPHDEEANTIPKSPPQQLPRTPPTPSPKTPPLRAVPPSGEPRLPAGQSRMENPTTQPRQNAGWAYRRAMPPLTGQENISSFIALRRPRNTHRRNRWKRRNQAPLRRPGCPRRGP